MHSDVEWNNAACEIFLFDDKLMISFDFLCRKLNLLSFGEEAEEEEKELAAVNTKIRSSHDVLNDPRLLKEGLENDLVIFFELLVIILNW